MSDIGFIPEGVKVDKRNPAEGRMVHFISISEDGVVNIWDTRPVEKDAIRLNPDFIWRPFITVPLIR